MTAAPDDPYFITRGGATEEVDAEGFVRAERSAGFRPKDGCGPFATAGFSSGSVSGRIEFGFEGPAELVSLATGEIHAHADCASAYDEARRLEEVDGRRNHYVRRRQD